MSMCCQESRAGRVEGPRRPCFFIRVALVALTWRGRSSISLRRLHLFPSMNKAMQEIREHGLMKKANHKSFQNSRLQVAATCNELSGNLVVSHLRTRGNG
ncbi:uncharacterized protein RCC_11362 [Ramularia collo-cygni]|uniref:Uncharacterized protein n=1 Tax=Ramularia collo-cygni TaxID=112498 RepID=A0A2D3VSN0_9PEZI|nr:uncharacterized protein RCC_11362 [Ramularia collo-cygni]CZT25693.1 uncharacterized protein RCC_11362 [Ramularia collo-cygni]